MVNFEFATATQIIFGNGKISSVVDHAARMGKRAVILTGKDIKRAQPLVNQITKKGLAIVIVQIPAEPTTDMALAAVQTARQSGCNLVIAIGGGSVVDTGKVIAALLTNQGDLFDYLEVIGNAQPLANPSAPYIAIPTTAGTGAEVTRNAVLNSIEHRVKVSMRSPSMLPRMAVIDPELTHLMPPSITAGTGLDALTQLLEVFVSPAANPITDGICREGLQRAAQSLQTAYHSGHDPRAREDMCIASLFSGIALANAKVGAVHACAAPLGSMYAAPHGMLCGRLLPLVMRTNISALQSRQPDSQALKRYSELGVLLTGRPDAAAQDGLQWIEDCCTDLQVPGLASFGVIPADIAEIASKALQASSMQGNPVPLAENEVAAILSEAL